MTEQIANADAKPSETSVLICSVGGSPEPVRKSIEQQRPEYVLFVASPESRKTIKKDIESMLAWQGIVDSHAITLSDCQNLLACVRDIRTGIEQGLRDMNLPEDTLLIADITGGTKVMSAALALVMMEYRSRFAYVGGDSRTKAGLGIVETGHEVLLRQDNPWDVMALREIRNLAHAFNSGQFATTAEIAKKIAANVTEAKKFYSPLATLMEAYFLWDGFNHSSALEMFKQAVGRLEPFAMNNPLWGKQLALFKKNMRHLEDAQQEAKKLLEGNKGGSQEFCTAYLHDLLANALRRMQTGRYDDAAARLYSCIEKSAKITLMAKYGIDNSSIDLSLVPESTYEMLGVTQCEAGCIRIALQKSFYLLDALQDPLGQQHRTYEKKLNNTLEARNMSLLAHGYRPVSEKNCTELFEIALTFLNVRKENLPAFPHLNWKSLII